MLNNNQIAIEMNIIPEIFEASIGGYDGPSYEVKLQPDGTVLYQHSSDGIRPLANNPKENGIEVSEEQWQKFRKALDRADIWTWNKYYDSSICDGTQWEVTIEYKDASVHSGGSNNYPPEQEFEQYRAAVNALLGGKDFQ